METWQVGGKWGSPFNDKTADELITFAEYFAFYEAILFMDYKKLTITNKSLDKRKP
ncbi:hypothetical protein [Flavobacterium soyangense]|uniref:hypothetical protein n=1 Tax=Flavobacterium soyangense TaxID=2023265 RepID=UPI001E385316|nr:hypothetical protein [Flavobacterium soyangense]